MLATGVYDRTKFSQDVTYAWPYWDMNTGKCAGDEKNWNLKDASFSFLSCVTLKTGGIDSKVMDVILPSSNQAD